MQRMLAMTVTNFSLPDLAVNVSDCDALDHCPEPLLYAVEPGDESLLDDSDMPDSDADWCASPGVYFLALCMLSDHDK